MSQPRILAIAYAAMPDAGSELGVGWMWSRMLATFGEAWVLTRTPGPDSKARRDARVRELGLDSRLRFVDVGLPAWTRLWRRDDDFPGGTRFQRVEYVLWLFMAHRRARALHRSVRFDLGWHLTWANMLGSPIAFLNLPYVLGPVGGGADPPWRLVRDLGRRGILFEIVRAAGQLIVRRLNFFGRQTWVRAKLILVQNRETREWLPASARARAVLFPNVILDEESPPGRRATHDPPRALFAGVLLPLKGVSLAIRTIELLPRWRLLICGDGPDASRLRALADRLGVADRVEFRGWQERSELMRIMREDADVFLFPSLRDQGPWVTAEAMAAGLPIVCLDHGGAPVIAGGGVAATSLPATVQALAQAVSAAHGTKPASVRHLSFEARRSQLIELLTRFDLWPPLAKS